MIQKQIGHNIQKYRKKHGYTQDQLAELLDISKVHLSHIEIGARSASLSLILSCCNVLCVTPNDLLEGAYYNQTMENILQNQSTDFDQGKLTSAISSLTSEDRDFVLDLMRLYFTNCKRKKEMELQPILRKK